MSRSQSLSPPTQKARRTWRSKRAAVAALSVMALGGTGAVVAQAAVPSFPDNVVVFPDRDFVTIEGYQDHIGEQATVTVTRAGQLIGQAVGTVGAGDVAFEINHPGGCCWGAGAAANMQVTPDIKEGDVVSIKFADGTQGETTTSGGVASDAVLESDGVTVTVKGTLDPAFNQAFVEQRIINPD